MPPAQHGGPVLHDPAAERAVLGSCLLGRPDLIHAARTELPTGAFYEPRHAAIWRAICTLHDTDTAADPLTVSAHLRAQGERWSPDDDLYLGQLYSDAPLVASHAHTGLVTRWARIRAVWETGTRLVQHATQAADGADITGTVEQLLTTAQTQLATLAAPVGEAPDLLARVDELEDFLMGEDEPFDWLVPQLLERGDRLILTGGEGKGKSTLLRQIGVQLAAGVHPFTLDPIEPLRVLIVDLENSARQVRRALRTLHAKVAATYKPSPGLHVHVRAEGLDLLRADDGQWLLQLTKQLVPDVLITGPLYKLASGDPTEEATARATVGWLDRVRAEVGCALILEAHAPYGSGPKRPKRPYGASLWSRWPEFGLYLDGDTGRMSEWRGHRDDSRQWPTLLRRGGAWPWTVHEDARETMWAQIQNACERAGRRLSLRDLATELGLSHELVRRTVNGRKQAWEKLLHMGETELPVDGSEPGDGSDVGDDEGGNTP